ncbi:MAG: 5-formyltetrahydrofolate cyclo-ligase [Verrucomicrobiota bacterium]
MAIAEEKARLRSEMRAKLRAMPEKERAEQSARISDWLIQQLPVGATVLSFAALKTEPNLDLLIEADLRLVFPRVVGDGQLDLWRVVDLDRDLAVGAFGIREPLETQCQLAQLTEIEAILVPGVAFCAADGARLGQGGGFYDRILSETEVSKLGVCFRQQLLDQIPTEEHDARVDQIALWSG